MISKAELEAMGCFSWYNQFDTSYARDCIGGYNLNRKSSTPITRDSSGYTSCYPNATAGYGFATSDIITTPSEFPLYNGTSASLSAWCKLSSINVEQLIFTWLDEGNTHYFTPGFYSTSGYPTIFINGLLYQISTPITNFVPLNEWFMITYNISKPSTVLVVDFYVNANLIGSATTTLSSIGGSASANDIGLYAFPVSTSQVLRGYGGQCMVFNKALSEEQINYIYEKTYIR